MYLNNKVYLKLLMATIVLCLLFHLTSVAFNVHDLFYLNKILAGRDVREADHQFYTQKNLLEHRFSLICFILYMVSFLTWLYRSYHNVYIREKDQAPFPKALVPFSLFIPILNFYAPYQIMKFIWWGNASSINDLNEGYQTVRIWWAVAIGSFILSRIYAYYSLKVSYADEHINLTYLDICCSIVSILLLFYTVKLLHGIERNVKTRVG